MQLSNAFNRLPDWANEAIKVDGLMNHFARLNFQYPTATQKLARLKFGFFIKEIVQKFSEKANGTLKPPDRSLYLYVAHDSTIGNVLNSLKLFQV